MEKDKEPSKRSKASGEEPSAYSHLQDVLQLLERTAEAKSWSHRLASFDDEAWRFATVVLSRDVAGQVQGAVTSLCDISIIDGYVRLAIEKTSECDHGLEDLREALLSELAGLPWMRKCVRDSNTSLEPLRLIQRLLEKFDLAVRQLGFRHDGRPAFAVEDEYDIQDFLHALLKLFFDDVRPEEVVPSYAGGSSRMDFLLKTEEIVIETKLASARVRDRQVGDQLILDIAKYEAHPCCKHLFCFIYDPGRNIRNPSGLEADLSRVTERLEVRVLVSPK